MSDIHKNFFGQMPSQKRMVDGYLYRRLEIGEIIKEEDILESKNILGIFQEISGQRYNPNRDHKHLIIWRKI